MCLRFSIQVSYVVFNCHAERSEASLSSSADFLFALKMEVLFYEQIPHVNYQLNQLNKLVTY